MAIKFYLQEKNAQHEIHCNTNSTITEIAGAFDLGTMELEWNECKYAIFPNTKFFIEDTESNEIWNFIIVEDNVEIIKKTTPVKYIHRLTLSQSVHKLNNVPLRNTVFTKGLNNDLYFHKGTVFYGWVEYDIEETGDYIRTQSQMGLFHDKNDLTFVKNNYTIDLTENSIIDDAYIEVSTILCTFNHATVDTYSSDITAWEVDEQRTRLINKCVDNISVSIYNASNTNEKISFLVSASDLTKRIYLSNSAKQFLAGKKVFIIVENGSILDVGDYVLPNIAGTGLREFDPLICGVVNVNLYVSTSKYSLYDVLDILNKQCIKQYNGSHLDNYYEMLTDNSLHEQILKETSAPEFVFTNMDLYEAVSYVLSYIDAFPILTENNVLDFQYLNDLNKDTIENIEVADIKTTLNETNFTNRLGTFYQQGKLKNPINFPAENVFSRTTTKNFGVPARGDWYYMVGKPIDYIQKFFGRLGDIEITFPDLAIDNVFIKYKDVRLASYSEFTSTADSTYDDYLDINFTPVLFEQKLQAFLPVDYASSTVLNQNNTLSYERNTRYIYLGSAKEFAGQSQDILKYAAIRAINLQFGFGLNDSISGINYTMTPQNYNFNCSYFPVLDGKVSQESTNNKAEKETIIAQANGNLSLEKLGNNLQGLIAKLGNEEKSITLPITKLKDKVKLGTYYIDELKNKWIVNKIQTTFTTNEDKVIVNAVFSKNFNAMQQFTSLNQQKRYYEIDESITSKGYENINEFIYFTNNKNLTDNDITNFAEYIALKRASLQSMIEKTLKYTSSNNEIANKNSVIEVSMIKTYGSKNVKSFITPILYGLGNQICFEFSFDSPNVVQNKYNGTNNTTEPYLYIDNDGKAEKIDLIAHFVDKNYQGTFSDYPDFYSLPGTEVFKLDSYYYYKKPNEIFHTNYSICFLPYWTKTTDALGTPQYTYEEIFFGDEFINQNGIIPNNIYDKGHTKTLYLYAGNDKFSIVENKVQIDNLIGIITISGETTQIATDSSLGTKCKGYFGIYRNGNLVNVSAYKSWCIADQDKNIYIAVNRNENSSNYAELKWFTSRNRKT